MTSPASPAIRAEMRLPSKDIREDLPFYTGTLGMRLEQIFPADDPAVAIVSGHGLRLRLERGAPEAPGTLRILTPEPDSFAGGARRLTAPGGTVVEIDHSDPPMIVPETEHAFAVRRLSDSAPWVIGRAGMHYRDLVPGRLGGAIIASHIRIPDGGPVPDMVHYHTIGFQLIFCHSGWVDLVYEDQGPPFRLGAGDCVIQPPEIRHRVLFASDNIEVVEIGVPAEHVTTIDHAMELPNGPARPERRFQGQSFVLHREEGAAWAPFRLPGMIARETGIAEGTGGVAGVQVARPDPQAPGPAKTGAWMRHDADILFGFVRSGQATLEAEGEEAQQMGPGDAFTIPPGMRSRLAGMSADFELLEVALPGRFDTRPAP